MKKVCCKCGVKKDISEFPNNKSAASGVSGRCKSCRNKKLREWIDKNPDQREKKNAARREYYWRHRDERLAYAKARFAAMPKKGRKVSPNSGAYYETLTLAQSPERPDKEEFVLAASDDGISLAAAISLLKMKPHMKVLALAIIGAGSCGADCHYLMETVLKRQCYATLKTSIFWLRRHLVGTGMKLESLGYGRGYRIVFEVAA